MKRMFGLLMALAMVMALVAPQSSWADEPSDEDVMMKAFDDMIAAFKEEDCGAAATKLGALDLTKMQAVGDRLEKKYPDGPPENFKKKMGEMMPAMQASMKKCATNPAYMEAMKKVGEGMK